MLTNVNVIKVVSLKWSWVRRLYNENFNEQKLIPVHYIEKYVGKEFKFHLIVKIPVNILGLFSLFYKEILGCRGKDYSQAPRVFSAIASQYLWFKNCINIDGKVVYFRNFSDKKNNFLKDILHERESIKTWGKYLTTV